MDYKKKGVTIYDLAKELKVSPSTVSRALNNHSSIGKKTKAKVKKLAKERGYRPNSIASSLRTNNSNTLGIMVSWIDRTYISSLIAGIEKTARESGYHVIISQSHDSKSLEAENLHALYDSRISALIVSMAMETTGNDQFNLFTDIGTPVVFVDRFPKDNNIHKVHINNFKAAFEATEHLISEGCKRIAHFGGGNLQSIYRDRKEGYIQALRKHNLEVDEALIVEARLLSAEDGVMLSKQVFKLDNPPDGIFCANDAAAVSAIQFAKSKGIKIPEELAIIGFNDDPICEIVDPPLSSVYHPAQNMGESAVRRALALLSNNQGTESGSSIIHDTHIVIRASSSRTQESKSKSRTI